MHHQEDPNPKRSRFGFWVYLQERSNMLLVGAQPPPPKRGKTPVRRSGRRLCCAACLTILALLVLVVIVLLILSRTLYKAKHPVTTVDSVSLRSLDLSILPISINLTLDLDLSLHNPNRVGFKYHDSTALLNFDDHLIGQVPIPAGEIGARDTVGMNLTLTVFANKLLGDSRAYADVIAGSLPLNSYTRISGKVTIFSFVKVKVVSTTSCNFVLFTSNRTIGNQQCEYKTKL
ncbi:hypothetical protein MLD38_032568 [Melastoma candidum]|uniref:Uncharacterized protein n=1 Tax=Melastoma candidum TaxID=119954 RepID=A0ACB9M3Y2_9MYRT|nr:hypothetical protein MLD38_032568 [Melastoma candidum]